MYLNTEVAMQDFFISQLTLMSKPWLSTYL